VSHGITNLEGHNCRVIVRNSRALGAYVNFNFQSDFESPEELAARKEGNDEEIVCDVLMIAVREGIAIHATDASRTTYTRVGRVYVPGDCIRSWREDKVFSVPIEEKDLGVIDYPDARSIVIL
jgi:hypothetical protein